MDNLILWLLFVIASLLVEIVISPGLFYFLSFSLGAVGAAIAAYCGLGMLYQILVFFGVSMLSLLVLTRFVKRVSKDTLHKSNVYALQGKKAVVTQTISNCQKGWVKIDGEFWSAASVDDQKIDAGEMVEIISSSGSHLKVKKVKGHC